MDQGKKLYAQEKYKKSQKTFQKVLRIDEEDAEAHYFLGKTLLKLNDLENASREFSTSLKINPQFSESFSHLGIIAIMKKDYDAAVTFLRNAILFNPQDISALNNLGFIYLIKKDYGEALKYYLKSYALAPQDPIANLNLAEIYRKVLLDTSNAIHHYQQYLAAQTQESATALEIRAWLQKAQEEHESKISQSEQAQPKIINLIPEQPSEQAEHNQIQEPAPETGLDIWHQIQHYEQTGQKNYTKALHLLQTALEKDPANAQYRKKLAAIYVRLGFLKQALRELKIVRNMGVEDAETMALWEQFQYLSAENSP